MRGLLEWFQRLRGSIRPARGDDDLREELRAHLDLAADREAQRGHAPPRALRGVHLESGQITQALDALRDQRGLPSLDALRSDAVFGWRQILRHPSASLAIVLSLGLAMGAALAAFRLLLYALVVGPLWLLSWLVPGVGQALYLGAWLVFTASYFALDYVDWPATRRGHSLRQRFGLLGRHPLRMLGFGFAVWATLFVPLLNLVFMPLSVAGGTLLFLDLEAGPPHGSSRTR